ncbi:MAG: hypothetical protein LJE59_06580 [Chromatiaceae bacterium]|nr:hypothetical protein [Chromatiaceae bacterium]
MLRDERLDWIGLLCRALLAGFATSIALGLLTLAFASSALAGSQEPGLRLYGAHGEALGQAPQLRTEVVIRVTGALARVRVVQRFRNASSAWVEGIYVFPLPEDAAVDRLQMRYAGRLIEGEVQEREQARQTYVQARAQG